MLIKLTFQICWSEVGATSERKWQALQQHGPRPFCLLFLLSTRASRTAGQTPATHAHHANAHTRQQKMTTPNNAACEVLRRGLPRGSPRQRNSPRRQARQACRPWEKCRASPFFSLIVFVVDLHMQAASPQLAQSHTRNKRTPERRQQHGTAHHTTLIIDHH